MSLDSGFILSNSFLGWDATKEKMKVTKWKKNVDVQKIRFDKEREKVDGQKKTVKGVIQLHY